VTSNIFTEKTTVELNRLENVGRGGKLYL